MSGSLATNLDANGDGLTALDYRKILQGVYPNPGIVSGGTVTGNSSLTYHVSPTVAVIDRGSDGTRLVYYAGGDTPAVAAGDASNRRIDVIWLKANDPALDGGSKEVVIGVTQGTPSTNPVVPTLDSGQLALMEKLVQPGTTNLSTGSGDNRSYNYAIPYGGSFGRLAYSQVTADYTIQEDNQWHTQCFAKFWVPSDRLVTVEWKACTTVGSGTNASDANANMGSYYLQILVDGNVVNEINSAIGVKADEVTSFRYDYVATVSYDINVTAGSHIVMAKVYGNKGHWTYPVTFKNGRQIKVMDRGVAR